MTTKTADWTDDSVYSNLWYVLPALVAVGGVESWTGAAWLRAVVLWASSVGLAGASAYYHAYYTRLGQRLDVTAMMTYLASLAATAAAPWSLWAYAGVPVAGGLYGRYTWQVNSYYHVPAWALLILLLAGVQIGWYALIPGGLFVAGGTIRLYDPGADTTLHSLWHALGGVAAASLVALVMGA